MAEGRRLTRLMLKDLKDNDSDVPPPKKKHKTKEDKKSKSYKTERSHKDITLKQKKGGRKYTLSQLTEHCLQQPKSRDVISVYKKLTFNIRMRADKNTCAVNSMCMLDSGDILITDRRNPVLKQINGDTYKIRNILKLPTASMSICKVSDTEAVVGLIDNSLQFVSIHEKLLPTRKMEMDHTCLGLCVISNTIYITDGMNRNLFVYTMDGKILKNVDGQDIFSWNRFIVESDDGNAIYVTDRDEGLVKMDKYNKVIWKCNEGCLKGAYGLCSDGQGNVFVAGYVSENVVKITADGTILGELVPSSICVSETSGLCFDRQKSKLYVSGGNGCDDIHVYYLK